MSTEMVCLYCGREFDNWSGRQKYCSEPCRNADFWKENPSYGKEWRRAKREVYQRQCLECGTSFETTDSRKKFCSNVCKVKFYNANRPTTKHKLRICPICNKTFRPMQKTGTGRIYCTKECRNKAMNSRRISANERSYWSKVKNKWGGNWLKAIVRDHYSCQVCGKKRTPGQRVRDKRFALEVHHQDGEGETGGKNHSLNNLLTLCNACHWQFHHIHLIKTDEGFKVKSKLFELLKIIEIKTDFKQSH